MKAGEKSLNYYWEALPKPREWKIVENLGVEVDDDKRELEKYIMYEWLSTHPMEGD